MDPYQPQTSVRVTVGYLCGWEKIIPQNVDVSDNMTQEQYWVSFYSLLYN